MSSCARMGDIHYGWDAKSVHLSSDKERLVRAFKFAKHLVTGAIGVTVAMLLPQLASPEIFWRTQLTPDEMSAGLIAAQMAVAFATRKAGWSSFKPFRGWNYQAERVINRIVHDDIAGDTFWRMRLSGAQHGLTQNIVTQTLTHSLLAGVFAADLGIAATLKAGKFLWCALCTLAVGALHENPQWHHNLWAVREGKQTLVLTNSCRDLLQMGGFITPSADSYVTIVDNSLFAARRRDCLNHQREQAELGLI